MVAHNKRNVSRSREGCKHDIPRDCKRDGGSVGSRKAIATLGDINPEALLADGLEPALVGFTVNHHHPAVAVYDIQKCIDHLVKRDGMTDEEAKEFLEFNTLGAYVGENGPLFVRFTCPQP